VEHFHENWRVELEEKPSHDRSTKQESQRESHGWLEAVRLDVEVYYQFGASVKAVSRSFSRPI
jgi:hypothetical protein